MNLQKKLKEEKKSILFSFITTILGLLLPSEIFDNIGFFGIMITSFIILQLLFKSKSH